MLLEIGLLLLVHLQPHISDQYVAAYFTEFFWQVKRLHEMHFEIAVALFGLKLSPLWYVPAWRNNNGECANCCHSARLMENTILTRNDGIKVDIAPNIGQVKH